MSANKFQVLSLDGGGLKGAFTAFFLTRLEEDLGVRVADHFDLITGTSTGGIIAIGLGMGLSPAEIFEFYVREGCHIFPAGRFRRVRRLFRSKFHNAELARALQDRLGQRPLGESAKRLVIPSYDLDADEPYLFKTAHTPDFRRDHKVTAWKVAMATSAAPTYLPAFTGIDGLRLIDGGVWANNPVMLGVTEAVSILDREPGSISVLSIGTTSPVTRRFDALDGGGLWRWKQDALDVAFVGQSKGDLNQASHLLVELSDGCHAWLTEGKKLPVVTALLDRTVGEAAGSRGGVPMRRAEELVEGDAVVFRDGGHRDVIEAIADGILKQKAASLREQAARWQRALAAQPWTANDLRGALAVAGICKDPATLRSWLDEHACPIGPRSREDLAAVAKVTGNAELAGTLEATWKAVGTLRSAHFSAGAELRKRLLEQLPQLLGDRGTVHVRIAEGLSAWVLRVETVSPEAHPCPVGSVNRLLHTAASADPFAF